MSVSVAGMDARKRPQTDVTALADARSRWPWVTRAALRHRVAGLLITHVLIFTLIYLLAYIIRFDGVVEPEYREAALATLPLVVGLKLTAFFATGSHRGWLRYASFADMTSLAEAATIGSVAVVATLFLVQRDQQVPRSILLMDWAGTILVLCGLRALTRLCRERYFPMIVTRQFRRVVVVGASTTGLALVREVRSQPHLRMRVVGFLDSDRTTHGLTLGGVRVFGSPADLLRLAERHQIETVLIPTPAIPTREVRALVTACNQIDVKFQVVPGFDALLSGALTVQPRDVDIHDLLCRDPVQLDTASVNLFLRDRVVLVTGAAGSIGSEICRQILSFQPRRLILLDFSENGLFFIEREIRALGAETEVVPCVASINDGARLRAVFDSHKPDVVFHAAAHKHVPMMESNPTEAVNNNVFGTRTLVDEAIRAGVEAFVMISTDKAVQPTSVMGATKHLAERYVQSLSERTTARLVTVRFGNVLGSNGSVVPIFKEQIRNGGPVTVTHPEMTRYFMTIPEAAQLVLQAGALGHGGEIFVLDMGEPIKVVDLARDMIRLSGLIEGREIDIIYTGLRPGEKLYEELYDREEENLPTPHPKIFLAQHRACSLEEVQAQLDRLARVLEQQPLEVTSVLRELVFDYHRPTQTEFDEVQPSSAQSSATMTEYVDRLVAQEFTNDELALGF